MSTDLSSSFVRRGLYLSVVRLLHSSVHCRRRIPLGLAPGTRAVGKTLGAPVVLPLEGHVSTRRSKKILLVRQGSSLPVQASPVKTKQNETSQARQIFDLGPRIGEYPQHRRPLITATGELLVSRAVVEASAGPKTSWRSPSADPEKHWHLPPAH